MTRDVLAWNNRDASKPPPLLRLRSSYWFIISVICIAVFTDIFLYGIIVPVIPFSLTSRIGIVPDDVQHWTSVLLAVYGAALIASSPICGHFADHTASRRLPLLIGLLALAGSTLLFCLGNSLALLIVGRILQGMSAAIVWTVGLALLADTVGHEKIGQAMGYVAMSMSVSVLIGPLLGGVVYDKAGYYAVFTMAFGLIGVDIVLRVLLVEKKIARQWDMEPSETAFPEPSKDEKLPVPATEEPAILAPQQPIVPEGLPTTVPAKRSPGTKHPILLLLTSRRLLAACYTTLSYAILMTAWDAVLPLRVHDLFGWSSLGAGLIFLPLILPTFIAPVIGTYADTHGPRLPVTLGFLLATPILVLLRFVSHAGIHQVVLLCALLALLGIALALGMTPLLAEFTYVVSHKEQTHPGAFGGKGAYATAYGLFNTAYAGGMLIGPLWGGFVNLKAGWGTLGWSLGVLCVVGTIVSALWTGGWFGEAGKRRGGEDGGGREVDGEGVGKGVGV